MIKTSACGEPIDCTAACGLAEDGELDDVTKLGIDAPLAATVIAAA